MVESKSTALPLGDAPTPGFRWTALAGGRTIRRGLPCCNCPTTVFPFEAIIPWWRRGLACQSAPFGQMTANTPANLRQGDFRPLLPQAGESIRRAFALSSGNRRSVAQSGSVPCSERGGRRFESYHSDHKIPEIADENRALARFFALWTRCARGGAARAAFMASLVSGFSGRAPQAGRL